MDENINDKIILLFDLYYDKILSFDDLKNGPNKTEFEMFITDINRKTKKLVFNDVYDNNQALSDRIKDIELQNIKMLKLNKNNDSVCSDLFQNTHAMKFILVLKGDEEEKFNIGAFKYNINKNCLFIFPDVWNLHYYFFRPKKSNVYIIVGDINVIVK